MSKKSEPVKIVLITGYLGAGKTTLLNKILSNDEGIRAAVIVNDIGEVNVDVDLIRNGGFSEVDDTLIPMTNGCICCTLSDDLANQLSELANSGDFDYIIIEASGICEPIPIAYTISAFCQASQMGEAAPMMLDNIVAVVDSARMRDEFSDGKDLLADDIDEEDIESLLIQQLEFCTTVILNKADMVDRADLDELHAIVRSLQKEAKIIEAVQADVPMDEILNTNRFDFERAYDSAAWIEAMEHPEEHEDPEVLEYEITTFVYKRRKPFDIEKLASFIATWPSSIIRSKGMMWSADDADMCYIFEQAGKQISMIENGLFIDSAPEDEKQQIIAENPEVMDEWDEAVGDRMNKIVFIGRHMDHDALIQGLDACLVDWTR